MDIYEYTDLADQLESLINRAERQGPFTIPLSREEILRALYRMSIDLRDKANEIDTYYDKLAEQYGELT